MTKDKDIHAEVEKAYGAVARQQGACGPRASSCCAGNTCCGPTAQTMPEADLGLSCGNPVALSKLAPGHIVLDLGSGVGRDVFLAAEIVGPQGRAIGVDMTMDMLLLANKNARLFTERTGLDNVEFRQGHIENIPADDASIDVVISNCVINLSPDKPAVFREVFRVLKPGGKMIVSDIVLNRELPDELKNDDDLYAACIAGALLRRDYLAAIAAAGFGSVDILSDRIYAASQACCDPITRTAPDLLEGVASSVTLQAAKPSSSE